MTARSDAGQSMVDFTDDIGIPERLVADGAGEFTGEGNQFVKEARHMRIQLHTSKQGRKNQNHAAEHPTCATGSLQSLGSSLQKLQYSM